MKNTSKPVNGLLADVATQCIHPESGQIGCWLFRAGNHREPGTSQSPIFGDLVELFTWMRSNGWTQIGHGLQCRYIYHDFVKTS